jgi:hypothetical protein
MTEKTVLQCEFHDYVPAFEIISELSQEEYQAQQTTMQDSQDDEEEYLVGGWDTIELSPTKTINRNKPQITTQQRIMQNEKDRVMAKLNRSRGYF